MNVLEIKGSLHDIISKIDDKNLLLKMFEALQDVIMFQETDVEWTSAQQKQLEEAIKGINRSFNSGSTREVRTVLGGFFSMMLFFSVTK